MDVTILIDKGENSRFHNVFKRQSALIPERKIYKGNLENKKCRFCGKNIKETTFKKKAHIIPEFMGNKYCFSNFECDDCNDYFGNLEDSLFNFAGVLNSLSTIKGKRGYAKFKESKEGIELFATSKNEIVARTKKADDEYGIIRDLENQTITIDTNQPSYIPLDAYKALLKIALCMLPDEEMENYSETISWIMSKNTTKDQFNPFFNIYRSVGGEKRFLDPWAVLYKKRENESLKNSPHHTLLLFYGIIGYQIFLPYHKDDEHLENEDEIFFTIEEHLIKEIVEDGKIIDYDIEVHPMWSPEKERNRRDKFTFGFSDK